MKIVRILLIAHVAALIFGLAGLLIALPHPELWAGNSVATQFYLFGIRYAGSLHILFGAATMLLFGLMTLGWRKTLLFFLAATLISLSSELLGTGTGFPFGAYAYTDFLGAKIGGRVPFSIPLSWFYMGFTSFLLASLIVRRFGARRASLVSVALGAYFLTVWDLTLDPAMAAEGLPIHFWIWRDRGPYFGMPLLNLVGWTLTGLTFIAVSRLLWRTPAPTRSVPAWLPFVVYLANCGFAIALNLGAGLWIPPLMAIALGILPASFALMGGKQRRGAGAAWIMQDNAYRVIKAGAGYFVNRNLLPTVEGLDNIPASGPVLIAARHYHHLYDGSLLESRIQRQVHILVALDWIRSPLTRMFMETLCAWARWPIVLRAQRESFPRTSAFAPGEAASYLRRSLDESVRLLRERRVLVVFPEGYPNIDPAYTPKTESEGYLPFQRGFMTIVAMAERDGRTRVSIVPAGFTYHPEGTRWRVTLRFGAPLSRDTALDDDDMARLVEARVRALSAPREGTTPSSTRDKAPEVASVDQRVTP